MTGVVVASAKKTFFAGGNLNEMVKAGPADAPAVFELAERVKASLRRLETFPKPVVAAINGAALGGGFEIAPGLQPPGRRRRQLRGRAPRGQPRPAPRRRRRHPHHPAARHPERADGRAAPGQHRSSPRRPRRRGSSTSSSPPRTSWSRPPRPGSRPTRTPYRTRGTPPATRCPAARRSRRPWPASCRRSRRCSASSSRARTTRHRRRSCRPPSRVPRSTSTPRRRIESRYLTNLVVNQGSKNMIQAFFFDLQAINAGKLRPQGIEPWKATKVGVLGAGMMGAGIAYVCARAGMEVVLKDVAVENADKGKAYSEKLLDKAISRGRSTEEKKAELLGRIKATADPADLAGCDLVIEAVFEDPALKEKVFAEILPHVQAGRAAVLQHLDAADHRARDRRRPARGLHRAALLLTRGQDAAGRDHQGRADLRRGAGQGVRRRAADPEDADRRQRQPRLLHLTGDRLHGQRGHGDARRGRAPATRSSGRPPRPATRLRCSSSPTSSTSS